MPYSRISQTKNILLTAANIALMQYEPNLHYTLIFEPSKFNHMVVARQRLKNLCSISMT